MVRISGRHRGPVPDTGQLLQLKADRNQLVDSIGVGKRCTTYNDNVLTRLPNLTAKITLDWWGRQNQSGEHNAKRES